LDGIALIMEALEAGTTPDVGILSMAPDNIKNSYQELTSAVAARLLGVGAGTLLENYMAQPELWDSTLADTLVAAGAGDDGELISLAQGFMEMMDPRRAVRGRFTVDFEPEDEQAE
jgi:hypothetical protein